MLLVSYKGVWEKRGEASLNIPFCIALTLGRLSMFYVFKKKNHIQSPMELNTRYPFVLLWVAVP